MKSATATVKCTSDDELFKTLSEELPVGVCVMQDGKFCYVNNTFPLAIGYTVDELAGRDSLEIVVPEDREIVKENTIKMLKGELRSPYQFRVTCKNRSIAWVMGTVKSIQYYGRPAVLGNYMEITERKQIEDARRKADAEKSAFLDEAPVSIVHTDLEGRITYINKRFESESGYRREEIIGKRGLQLDWFPASTKKYFAERLAARLEGSPPKHWETQFKCRDGRWIWIELEGKILRRSEVPAGFQIIATNITERKQAEEALRRSEERYRTILEEIGDGYFETDLTGDFTFVNGAQARLLGYSKEEIIGMNFRAFTPGDNVKRVFEAYNGMYRTGEPLCDLPAEVIRKDGSHGFAETSAFPIRNDNGEIVGFRGIRRDITEHRQAQEALRESEERYRALFDRSLDCVYIHDFEGNFLDANETALRLLGYERKDIPHLDFASLLSEDQFPKALATLQELRDTGAQTQVNEFRVKRKDGSFVDLETIAAVIYHNGRPYAIQGIGRNVTESNRVREALEKSEERYRTLAENAGEAIFVIQDGVIKFMNSKGAELSGYSIKALVSRPFVGFIHPDDINMVADRYDRRLKGEPVPETYEFRIVRKDGVIRWGELNAVPISWEDRPAVLCFMGDVTERRQAVEALRQSEERYRTMLEEMEDSYFEVDLGGHLSFFTDAVCRDLGYSREELMGKSYKDFTAEEDIESLFRAFGEVYRTGVSNKGFPWKTVRKDGVQGFVEASVSPVRNDKGEIIGFRGVGRDISERKKQEQALADEATRRRILIDQSLDGIVVLDVDARVVEANQRFAEMLGYTMEEIRELHTWDWDKTFPREKILEMGRNADEKGFHLETKHTRKDGVVIDVDISVNGATCAGQKLIFSVCRDITARKEAEDVLRRIEQERSAILNSMTELMVYQDAQHRILFANRAAADSVALPIEQLVGGRCYETWHHSNKPCVGCPVAKARETSKPEEAEMTTPDGRTWFVRGYPVRDADENLTGAVEVALDITERKQAEEALRQSEENYRALFDSSVIGTIVLDAETGEAVMANQAAAKIFEFRSPQEGIGRSLLDFILPEDREMVRDAISQDLFDQDLRRRAEFRAVTSSGREIWLSVTAARIMHDGRLAGLISFADITEQKRQNQRLMMTDRLASIGELASGTAHELNNPLTSIIGFSQLLMEREVRDDIREDLKLINSEAQRAADVTRNLLTFARKHAPVKQLSHIDSIIEDVLRLRAYEHKTNNITVVKHFDPSLPQMMIDHFQMQQVFMNIIINAEYFMTAAHKKGTLTITTRRQNSSVVVSFADDGPGIAPENVKRVFDPFFTTKETGKGTGLGLSICHGIVTEHGGQVYASSQLGKGATIFIELPINGHNDAQVIP
jgi:PAS domain S-box-containing protein